MPDQQGAALETVSPGRLRLSGELSFDTVAQVLEAGDVPLRQASCDLEVDLSGVKNADSAGLALLIEWLRIAKAAGHRLRYRGMPDQLLALARIGEVEDLLAPEPAGV